MYVCIHICVHAYIHTYKKKHNTYIMRNKLRSDMHTHTHTHTHTHIYIYIYIYIWTCRMIEPMSIMHVCMCNCMYCTSSEYRTHTYIHTYIHTYTRIMRVCHVCMCKCMYCTSSVYIHIHVRTHTYIHTLDLCKNLMLFVVLPFLYMCVCIQA